MTTASHPHAIPDEVRRTLGSRVHSWIVTVDHKRLGMMYVGFGLLFFVIGGIEAALMRSQLAQAAGKIIDPATFNQLFTMHGTTMVFLVGMPILLGMGNYLIPLMVGARDMAFPRLNAFGLWLFVFGACLLYYSYVGAQGLYGTSAAP
ncbi:MAG: cbb3-type cytochrome c oxidase subunit I, partial [Phycisphaerales bacterium]